MTLNVIDFGIILTVLGIGLGLWRKRRKFKRTNFAGTEQFQSFSGMMVATAFDGLLYWMGLGSVFIGLLILTFF